MNFETPTLTIVLALSCIMQAGALFIQYLSNRRKTGLLWSSLGNLSLSLVFAVALLPAFPSIPLFKTVTGNILCILSIAFLYMGVLRFLTIKSNAAVPAFIASGAVLIALYSTCVEYSILIQRLNISAATAVLSLLIIRLLVKYRIRPLAASLNFLVLVFFAYGLFYLLSLVSLVSPSVQAILPVTLLENLFHLAILISSSLWTFGFILLVNYQLLAENHEDQTNRELIFNTSPDAVSITRVSDGAYIEINEGFTALTGYSRSNIIGKTSGLISIWQKAADRDKLIERLQESSFCEGLIADFRRKDGSVITGQMSARILPLHQEAHIISVTRDITEQKKSAQQIHDLIRQLEMEKNFAEKNALSDGLTGLANRRFLDEALAREFYRLKRSASLLSLIMIDIDHFKKFNDLYGHVAGDDCLRQIADSFRSAVARAPDIVARYGGEEFLVILPETDNQGAMALAEHLRKTVEGLAIPHGDSLTAASVTISLGVATVSASNLSSPEQAIEAADRALYMAKRNGRNRVETDRNWIDTKPEAEALVWYTNYECGNTTINDQHKNLFFVSNALLKAVRENQTGTECGKLLDTLLLDISAHFRYEEEILHEAEFPLVEEHMHCHEELSSKAAKLAERYRRDALSLKELYNFIAYEVVDQHMLIEDKKFFPYV